MLRGKGKPLFAYNMDCGDFVVVVNADKVRLTGNKRDEIRYWHSGWPDGLKSATRGQLLDETPVKLVEKSIWGMVPKTRLGRQIFGKLKVYAGPEHPHSAQNPEPLKVTQD